MELINDNKKSHKRKKRNKKKSENTTANTLSTPGLNPFDDVTEDKYTEIPNMNTNDSDSENEGKPKKKKKKKQIVLPADASGSKNKKSIRQIKRERHAQRLAETQAVAKDQTKSECLNYLSQWKHNRQHWKFMKVKQAWLYKNKFSETLVPNEYWPILLEYFEPAKGNIRNMLLKDANDIMKQMDDWTESQSNQEEVESADDDQKKLQKPSESTYNRARELIQFLQE